MQATKMPDGTIIIQLHNATEFNALGTILMSPTIRPEHYTAQETELATQLGRRLAQAMIEESGSPLSAQTQEPQ